MEHGHRVDPREFRALPIHVHAVLEGVPLRDVTVIDLPGGGEHRTLSDLRKLLPHGSGKASGRGLPGALFAFRRNLGRVLGWDTPGDLKPLENPIRDRIPREILESSVVPAGTRNGLFETLYELERESLVEARNKTAHAFLATVLEPRDGGYRLHLAVYVRRVSWLTPVYMALIEPFRRFVVYPSMMRNVARAWDRRYARGK